MAEPETNSSEPTEATVNGWMSDVQRAIALILVGSIAFCMISSTMVAILVSEPSDALVDMTKTLQAAAVNMTLIALGFFFGSSMSKTRSDAGQQKIMEKLTSSAPPLTGPVAPVPAPVVIVAWWSLLTEAERVAITEAAVSDAQVQAFVTASTTGMATVADLDYLVSLNLLTQGRATAIQSA